MVREFHASPETTNALFLLSIIKYLLRLLNYRYFGIDPISSVIGFQGPSFHLRRLLPAAFFVAVGVDRQPSYLVSHQPWTSVFAVYVCERAACLSSSSPAAGDTSPLCACTSLTKPSSTDRNRHSFVILHAYVSLTSPLIRSIIT